MIPKTGRHMPVIRLSDQVDDIRRQRLAVGLVISMNRISEHGRQVCGPMFVITLHPVLKLPQYVRGTERVLYIRDRIVWLPEIMDRDTCGIAHHIPASRSHPEESQQRGTGDMQPVELPLDTDPRLIHVLDRRLYDRTPHRPGKALIRVRTSGHHVDDGPLGQVDTKQIPEGLHQPLRRNQLIGAQIDRKAAKMGTVLHGRLYTFRKRRLCCPLTARTHTAMANVISHNERQRLRKILHLPDLLSHRQGIGERGTAMNTDLRIMMFDPVRRRRPVQRRPRMAF